MTSPANHVTGEENFIGDLSKIAFKTEYRSLKEDPASLFYRPCLLNSQIYKRAVGYFRSSVYIVVGASVIEFARRGGRIQLICSPDLDANDIDGIANGYSRRSEIIERRLVADIDRMLSEPATSYHTKVLATLITAGSLDIQLALRADRKGIYHEKIGIFCDKAGHAVSFKGSANETFNGWHLHGNFESIEVFCSWRGGLERTRVEKHKAHFDELWSGRDTDVEVFPFPVGAAEHLKKASFDSFDDIEDREIVVAAARRTPLPHQISALEAWAARDWRGILKHATGSGKTFTAILALRDQIARGLPALVLVPSKLLLEQWRAEIQSEFPETALLVSGGGHVSWRVPNRIEGMTNSISCAGGRIVLATMATASSNEFRTRVVAGDHLLLVVDEVHQIGSPANSNILELNAGARLGLSATPERYGDPEGTQRILDYFGGIIPPPISLDDAIRSGRLVPYEYHPHPINLTATEADEWKAISREIRFEVARQKKDSAGRAPLTDRAKMMLIRRARIAKKASNKIGLASKILRAEFEEGQRWLIYCEDSNQLEEVLGSLRNDGLSPIEYHSSMAGDRDAALKWFEKFGGALVSIRCLDEGVDIPAMSHALILASSQNPRQFIQRRGRVLRTTPGKTHAVIHDAIVVPVHVDHEPEQAALLKSEMARAIEFANNAMNKMAAAELRSIAADLGINVSELCGEGIEEDADVD